ncbi:type II toxin-antitoxin system VapC family toxin [Sphingobacterium sp. SGG-5]|uniref:type II toxin-antitoxin system VapC family toxin n=1 Tax=Sphingobacterium sp. SGG-5 TaxID=2710881 RepID=UPI0013EA2C12|nr:type II toxin-antitoxin system VapC family toxin [Sphingobacterium sp. SGG-5]NGM63059.1 type II toxin-antitoxin system VapC family toxin [Sphingobacterium sp. SGG-5]
MNLLFDTNILILLAKDHQQKLIDEINPDNRKIFISIVSIAELKSLALRHNWGIKKWQVIHNILDEAVIIEINENLVDTYTQIDNYSQRRNPLFSHYPFTTPRNMGKNDLWIASTAALLGLKLITADKDFTHLNDVFMEVQTIRVPG